MELVPFFNLSQSVPNSGSDSKWICNLISFLYDYYTPVIIIKGLITNTIALFIIKHPMLIRLSYNNYILAKLCADNLALISWLCSWLTDKGYNLHSMTTWCHFIIFLTQSSSFLSLWYHVCFLMHRFMALFSEYRERKLCTVIKVRTIIIGLALVAVTVFLNISLMVGVVNTGKTHVCLPLTRFIHFWNTLQKLDVCVNGILPYSMCALIAVIFIIKAYYRQLKLCWIHFTECYISARKGPNLAQNDTETKVCIHNNENCRIVNEDSTEMGNFLQDDCTESDIFLDEDSLTRRKLLLSVAYAWIHLIFTLPSQLLRWSHVLHPIAHSEPQMTENNIWPDKLLSYLTKTFPALNFWVLFGFHVGLRSEIRQMWSLLSQYLVKCRWTSDANRTQGRKSLMENESDQQVENIALADIDA